jgi:hypothetical protein
LEKNPLVAYPDQMLDRLLEAIEESEARIPSSAAKTRSNCSG